MEEFLRHYGLWAIYVGMWLEGETVLVVSGFLASQGVLPRGWVLLVALLGALSVDNAIFYAGRHASRFGWLRKFLGLDKELNSWRSRLGESWTVFLMVRFIYGTRTPFLFYMGTRRMTWLRFIARDAMPVTIWCCAWFFFGHAISGVLFVLLGGIRRHHRVWIVVAIATASLLVILVLAIRRHLRLKKPRLPEPEEGAVEREKKSQS